MSNIAIVSHGIRGSTKAISKTARRCPRSMAAKPASARRSCHGLRAFLWWRQAPARRTDRRPMPPHNRRAHYARAAGRRAEYPRANVSTANTQPFNQTLVAPFVHTPEIIENLTALRNELEQPAPRMVVFD